VVPAVPPLALALWPWARVVRPRAPLVPARFELGGPPVAALPPARSRPHILYKYTEAEKAKVADVDERHEKMPKEDYAGDGAYCFPCFERKEGWTEMAVSMPCGHMASCGDCHRRSQQPEGGGRLRAQCSNHTCRRTCLCDGHFSLALFPAAAGELESTRWLCEVPACKRKKQGIVRHLDEVRRNIGPGAALLPHSHSQLHFCRMGPRTSAAIRSHTATSTRKSFLAVAGRMSNRS